MRRNEESLLELQGTIEKASLQVIGVPEGEEKKGEESLFKQMMAKNFPNL